ncbi:T9SS type A sorting domain-containing protein [Flavobacterium sp. Root186]|uniref:T9SS type A sorting domain-containing protein n=1 Tax=Flavobacterium sp. Root186 TaxID=1736485 RepID=UPI0006FC5897|nr:T9SS type A sorting domain-containing protein [Flavobacterium sp. Root186]KRB56969.1 hypothetical protein ASD98_09850 [Flavobacterium sp. Root186]
MRKNYIYAIFVFLLAFTSFGQKVTLTPTAVNGQSVSGGPINLGSNASSSVSLSVTVEMPAIPGNSGTITIHSVNGLNDNIVINGNGGALFFGEGKTASRSFVVTLTASNFSTSGYIYAEYKTGVVYKSNNLSVIKNGVPPTPPVSPNPQEEIGPYGGTPLFPEFTKYYSIASQDWINDAGEVIKTNTAFYDPVVIRERTTFSNGAVSIPNTFRYYVVDFLPYHNNLKIDNFIQNDQYLLNGENPRTILGNQATETHTENTTASRPPVITKPLNNYQWQSRIKYPLRWDNITGYFQTYGWKDISGATQINYTPTKSNLPMEYRRLILENITDKSDYRRCATSNIIDVVPLITDLTKNTICCDQTVSSDNLASPITGTSALGIYYQWLISEDNVNWTPIYEATNQNYTPIKYGYRNAFESKTQYYKRIVYDYTKNINYLSNIVKIIFEAPSGENQSIKIYPNPTTSLLNIETTRATVTITNSTITNSTGNTVTPASNTAISLNLTKLDVSNLQPGIYFINMFVTTIGSSRGYTSQSTFIKQ